MLGIVWSARRPYKGIVQHSAGLRALSVCLLLSSASVAEGQTRPAVVDSDIHVAAPDGTTALHLAAEREDTVLVQTLIAAGANVRAVNRYGVAPLSVAASTGNAAIVTALLDAFNFPFRK